MRLENNNLLRERNPRFVQLLDSRATGKAFEFDRVMLMPTAAGYRALVSRPALRSIPG